MKICVWWYVMWPTHLLNITPIPMACWSSQTVCPDRYINVQCIEKYLFNLPYWKQTVSTRPSTSHIEIKTHEAQWLMNLLRVQMSLFCHWDRQNSIPLDSIASVLCSLMKVIKLVLIVPIILKVITWIHIREYFHL